MYGEGKNWRYLIGLGAVIVLLFFVIYLIVHSGGHKDKVPETNKALTSYTNDDNATVTETIIGPITAPETHHELEINVTNSMATINVMKGYDGNVINSRSYPTTTTSFGEFLSALDKAGFTKGNTDDALKDDSGYCATGQRYIFTLRDGSNTVERFWVTSCGGPKTYKGNRSATLQLFQAQIPDYNDIINNTDLGSSGSLF